MVDTSATAAISARRPRVLFLGSEYAGWRTRFRSLRRHTEHDRRIRPTYRSVTGWVDGGWIERLPVLPTALKGRARALVEASAFASLRRPDVLWTSAATALGPFLWSQLGPMRRPLVLDLDETFEIREAFAPVYHGRPAHRGLRARALRMQEAALWRSVTLFTPPFEWMANSLRRGGVEEERIRVIPPGVDLEAWSPPPSRAESGDRLRVVFVGQDFWRKGGDLLIEAIAGPLAEYCELDIVTAADVDAPPGIRVHNPEQQLNSPQIRDLYARADIFVMPTRAECFGFAILEAMASGLPVIAGDVGAIHEFVEPERTGWLIEPALEPLVEALRAAVANRQALPAMGRRARAIAEQRFESAANDSRVVDVVLEAHEIFRSRASRRGARPPA